MHGPVPSAGAGPAHVATNQALNFQSLDISAFIPPRYYGSLEQAILDGNQDEVRRLLASGAAVNDRNTLGSVPLRTAMAVSADLGIIKLLIRYGANVNAVELDGRTTLHLAVGRVEVLKYLVLKSDALLNVSAQDSTGETPLVSVMSYLRPRNLTQTT